MTQEEKKENNIWELDDELMFSCALRYCIGRRSYVATLVNKFANDGIKHLSDERLKFTSQDIRKELMHILWISPYRFQYAGTVFERDRKPVEDFIEFINQFDDPERTLATITGIEVYHESYKEGEPHKYHISRCDTKVNNLLTSSDINELIPWANLAAFFDKEHYKKIKLKDADGNITEVLAYESYTQATELADETKMQYRNIPWKYVKVYRPVDKFDGSYYIKDCIISVEDA